MNTLQNTLNPQTEISAENLHKAVILYNHLSSDEKKKSALRKKIESCISSFDCDVTWELIPV